MNLLESMPVTEWRKHKVPVLDQGDEGACTGFALATVVNYLMRTKRRTPDLTEVSPFYLYDLARLNDEWAGNHYEGSSCRGALKGWKVSGACRLDLWPKSDSDMLIEADSKARKDGQKRPMGRYYRVNYKEPLDIMTAIIDIGVVYCSADIHSGWDDVGTDGIIAYRKGARPVGGHAFVIVGWEKGHWVVQNSWGNDYGDRGFCYLSFEDFLANASDAWVATLGVPNIPNE